MKRVILGMMALLLVGVVAAQEQKQLIGSGYQNGFATNFSADGDYLAVARPNQFEYDSGGNRVLNTGAVNIYARNTSDEWELVHELKAEEQHKNTYFGAGIALIGENLLVTDKWRRCVVHYKRDGADTQWVEQDTLNISGGTMRVHGNLVLIQDGSTALKLVEFKNGAFEHLGQIKMPADLQGFPFFEVPACKVMSFDENWLFVGVPQYDFDANNENELDQSGIVLVFKRSGNSFTYHSTLAAQQRKSNPTTNQGGMFGSAVAVEGNWLVVGAMDDRCDEGREAGAVYLFALQNDKWVQKHWTWAYGYEFLQHFGTSVMLHKGNIVVGTDHGGPSGKNYIYHYYIDSERARVVYKGRVGGIAHQLMALPTSFLASYYESNEIANLREYSYDQVTVGTTAIHHTQSETVVRYNAQDQTVVVTQWSEQAAGSPITVYDLSGRVLVQSTLPSTDEPTVQLPLQLPVSAQVVLVRIGAESHKLWVSPY